MDEDTLFGTYDLSVPIQEPWFESDQWKDMQYAVIDDTQTQGLPDTMIGVEPTVRVLESNEYPQPPQNIYDENATVTDVAADALEIALIGYPMRDDENLPAETDLVAPDEMPVDSDPISFQTVQTADETIPSEHATVINDVESLTSNTLKSNLFKSKLTLPLLIFGGYLLLRK